MSYNKVGKIDVAFDIETVIHPVTQADIDEYMASYKPPASVKKVETEIKYREQAARDAVEEIAESRRFSIDGKRAISIAAGVVDHQRQEVRDIECWYGDDAARIASGFVNYLDGLEAPIRLIGWNSGNFDTPELIKTLWLGGRLGQRRKISKWDLIDLSYKPFPRMKLKTTAKAFGFEILPGDDGAAVAQMYAESDWERLERYNKHDVYLTGMLAIAAANMVEL